MTEATHTLAPELAEWRAALADFDPKVVTSLADPLRRLAAALGPPRWPAPSGRGEPAGFEGLSRRGHPEHLLATEWLLAGEVPDEFLRRAVDGELAHLAPHRIDPAEARRCVALFDGGPDQLGAPRLLHLVALLVLARRATLGHASFAWGLLQEPEGVLLERADPAAAMRLQAARTAREATPADLEAWIARLGPPRAPDDLWVVGGARVRALAPPGTLLLSGEPAWPAPEAPPGLEVTVEARAGGRATRRLWLPLPDDAAALHLLRRPLSRPRTPTIRSAPAEALGHGTGTIDLALSFDGTRLLRLTAEGALAAHHVPNRPGLGAHRLGATRVLAPEAGQRLLGGAFWKRNTLAVLMDDTHLLLRRGGAAPRRLPRPTFTPHAGLAPLAPPGWHDPHAVLVADALGVLYRLPLHGPEAVEKVATGVVGLGPAGYLRLDFSGAELDEHPARVGSGKLYACSLVGAEVEIGPMTLPLAGLTDEWVIWRSLEGWRARSRHRQTADRELDLPWDARLVGALAGQEPRPVWLAPDRQALLVGPHVAGDAPLTLTLDEPVKLSRLSPRRELFACLFESGGIAVFGLDRDQLGPLLTLRP